MRKCVTTFAAIVFVGAIGSAAFAGPIARFDNGYLDEHPEVTEQLCHDPHLVDNPQFMAAHPGLIEYFHNHPEIRAEIRNHPDRFMAREHYYENHGDRGGAHPLATTDHYMDAHPDVAQQLNRDPALVDNRIYVDHHPGLEDYLRDHPIARRDWRSHPYEYMAAEHRYDHKH